MYKKPIIIKRNKALYFCIEKETGEKQRNSFRMHVQYPSFRVETIPTNLGNLTYRH